MTTDFEAIYHCDANKDTMNIYLNPEIENESEIDDILSNCSSTSIYDGYRGNSFSSSNAAEINDDYFTYDQDDPFINGDDYPPDDVISSILQASSSEYLPGKAQWSHLLDPAESETQKTTTDILKLFLEGSDFQRKQIVFFGEEPPLTPSGFIKEEMENPHHDQQQDNTDETKPQVDQSDKDEKSDDLSPEIPHQKVKRKKRKYERRASARKNIQLYQFMLRLLDDQDDCVAWVSREEGIFRLLKSKAVAQMWGKYKKNDNMTYESLSRALRHYYSQEILVPVPKKLHYKFCRKTLEDWYKSRESN